MKKQVYSTPKTRLVTMAENNAIMAGSGNTVTDYDSNAGISGKPKPGNGTGPSAPRSHSYTGSFMDFN